MRNDRPWVEAYISKMVGWVDGERSVRIPDVESGDEAFERFDSVVCEATSLGHETVAMVSHGAMLRFWIAAAAANVSAGFIAQNFIPNAGIVVLLGNPRDAWQLESWPGGKQAELAMMFE